MASKTSRGVALIPLTITYGIDRSDVTLPQSIPLVELLPGMVETVGAFADQPTNDGFAVRTASGRLLDQSKSLSAQGVRAGAALTLETLSPPWIPPPSRGTTSSLARSVSSRRCS